MAMARKTTLIPSLILIVGLVIVVLGLLGLLLR